MDLNTKVVPSSTPSFCRKLQIDGSPLENFKFLTRDQPDAPVSLAKINITDPGVIFIKTKPMENNKNMALYLCHLEKNISELKNNLDEEINARQAVEIVTQCLKVKYQRETKQLQERLDSELLKKQETYLKTNKIRIDLESEIIKWKREFRSVRKELTRENEKYRVIEWKLNGVRKEQVQAEDALTRYKTGASKFINFERERLNEKCRQLTEKKRAYEVMVKELKKGKEEFKNVSNERKLLLKQVEDIKTQMSSELEVADKKFNSKCVQLEEKNRTQTILRRELEKVQDEFKTVTGEKDYLLKELQDANQKLNEKCTQLDEEKRDQEILMDELRKVKEKLNKVSIDKNDVLKEFQDENKRLNEKYHDLEKFITEEREAKKQLEKELEIQREELQKTMNEKVKQQKEFSNFRQSISMELEAANKNLSHERNSSKLTACSIHRMEGTLKIKEADLVNAQKEIDQLRKQVCQQGFSQNNDAAMKVHISVIEKKLHDAEKELNKYESKYKDVKAQFEEIKKSLKHSNKMNGNHGCIECDQKLKQLENIKQILKKKENEAREMFGQLQMNQQSTHLGQVVSGSNTAKNKKESLIDMLPAVNIINEDDLFPVLKDGKPVIIGEGNFGKVSLMKYVPLDLFVAVKSVFNGTSQDIILEGRAMQLASGHSSFPVMLGLVQDSQGLPSKIVSKFIGDDVSMQCSSLQSLISKRFANKESVKNMLLNVCHGLRYLHQNNIVHNDIKSENILINCENGIFTAKIIDMGGITSHILEPPAAEAESSDIFALSVVMLEVAQSYQWKKLTDLAIQSKKTRPPIDEVISCLTVLDTC